MCVSVYAYRGLNEFKGTFVFCSWRRWLYISLGMISDMHCMKLSPQHEIKRALACNIVHQTADIFPQSLLTRLLKYNTHDPIPLFYDFTLTLMLLVADLVNLYKMMQKKLKNDGNPAGIWALI